MSAYINAQYFFFKCQAHLLAVLSDIRHTDIKFFLCILCRNIKQRDLTCHIILLIFGDMIQDLHVHTHALLSGGTQAIQSSCFDKVFNGTFIHIQIRYSGNKILQIGKSASFLSLSYNTLDHRTTYCLDSSKCISDTISRYGESTLSFIDIRRQHGNTHISAGQNIFRYLFRIIDNRGQKSSHEFYRIIMFQIGGLICNHCVASRVRFVERILCEVHHIFINLACNRFCDPFRNTSRYALFLITIYKVRPFFFHNRLFLFTHSTTHQVTSSQRISAQISYNLHNLFLINDTAIGRGKDRL